MKTLPTIYTLRFVLRFVVCRKCVVDERRASEMLVGVASENCATTSGEVKKVIRDDTAHKGRNANLLSVQYGVS